MAVVFHGTHAELTEKIQQLVDILSGQVADTTGIAHTFLMAVGYAALSDIKEAYVTKARGGTDAMGVQWPPLSPVTIANRRVGQKDLENPTIRQRERIRKREEKKAYERLVLSLPEGEARRRAKRIGSIRATQQTGLTKIETLGNRQVEILRDTGVLLNSLTPGTLWLNGYSPPGGEGGENQIFAVSDGVISIGTKDIRFNTHQFGRPPMGGFPEIPQRKIFPEGENEIPEEWWANWLDAGTSALEATLANFFGQ